MPVAEAVRTMLASFPTVDDASRATSGIIAAGIIPAALEMMDALTISALMRAGHKGLPADAAAVLLVELEGLQEGVDEQVPFVEAILTDAGASETRSEPGEVINVDGFLQFRNFADLLLEAVLPKKLMFLFLELLSESAVLVL